MTWTSALLLALSAASGLSLPAWLAALLAALAARGRGGVHPAGGQHQFIR